MPRIYTGSNDPLDFCLKCFPTEKEAEKFKPGEGPDNRGNCYGYDAEHPPYEGEGYKCCKCGTLLGTKDDGIS